MTLYDIKKGKEYVVEESTLKQPIKRRMEAMGLIEGTRIRKINQGLDGSVIFIARGIRMAIGKEIAKEILVREASESDYRSYARRMGKGHRYRGKRKNQVHGEKRGNISGVRKDN
mgnify:CR=1 FL=1